MSTLHIYGLSEYVTENSEGIPTIFANLVCGFADKFVKNNWLGLDDHLQIYFEDRICFSDSRFQSRVTILLKNCLPDLSTKSLSEFSDGFQKFLQEILKKQILVEVYVKCVGVKATPNWRIN